MKKTKNETFALRWLFLFLPFHNSFFFLLLTFILFFFSSFLFQVNGTNVTQTFIPTTAPPPVTFASLLVTVRK